MHQPHAPEAPSKKLAKNIQLLFQPSADDRIASRPNTMIRQNPPPLALHGNKMLKSGMIRGSNPVVEPGLLVRCSRYEIMQPHIAEILEKQHPCVAVPPIYFRNRYPLFSEMLDQFPRRNVTQPALRDSALPERR